jgi:hypothetical protein
VDLIEQESGKFEPEKMPNELARAVRSRRGASQNHGGQHGRLAEKEPFPCLRLFSRDFPFPKTERLLRKAGTRLTGSREIQRKYEQGGTTRTDLRYHHGS